MGLDISIGNDLNPQSNVQDYLAKKQTSSLSRDFCQLLSRRYLYPKKSEIEQLAQITTLDFQAWYDMEHYPDEVWLKEDLFEAPSEVARQKIRAKAEQARVALQNNLPKVFNLTESLVQRIEQAPEIFSKIIAPNQEDQYWVEQYFKPTGILKDLRKMLLFLEYLQAEGATMVYWQLG